MALDGRSGDPALQVSLADFAGSEVRDVRRRGRMALWLLVRAVFFTSAVPWPMRLKSRLLRFFGARVGDRLYIRPGVSVHYPWRLRIGDDCWLGEDCVFLNHALIELSHDVALGHQVMLASGGHDIESTSMAYKHSPITIDSQVWLASRVTVLGGVRVGEGAVVAAGACVTGNVEPWTVVGGVPAKRLRQRRIRADDTALRVDNASRPHRGPRP